MKRFSVFFLIILFATTLCLSELSLSGEEPPNTQNLEIPEEPSGELDLAQALALALERNPGLTPYEWEIRAAEARAIQAGLRPNPELALELEDVRLGGGDTNSASRMVSLSPTNGLGIGVSRSAESKRSSSFGDSQITLTLSQLVELGGKRAKRVEAANRERDVVAWDYEVARADVLSKTAHAFYAVLAAQEQVMLAEQLFGLAEHVHQTIKSLVEAGQVSGIEESRSQVELSKLSIERDRAQRELTALRIELAGQWGSNNPVFTSAVGAFPESFAPPAPGEILPLVQKSAYLERWVAELEMRDAVVALERVKAKPDLTVNFGLRNAGESGLTEQGWDLSSTNGVSIFDGDTDSNRDMRVVLGISVPLPLFNRNQGSILEAENLALKTEAERSAVEAVIINSLSAGYERATAYHIEVQSLTATTIPTAQVAFESVQEGYRAGKFSLLDVLLAQKSLFDSQRQLAQAKAAFQQTVVEIERFTGMPLKPSQQVETEESLEVNP